jgi:hypothetical protein
VLTKKEMSLYECVLKICVFGMSFTLKDVYVCMCVCALLGDTCILVLNLNVH